MMLSEWVAPLCGGFGDFDPRGTAEIVMERPKEARASKRAAIEIAVTANQ
jgi:hypothetical protein